ncbi:MAG: ATP-binding protein [Leeuwenhoekiella sp.]
MNSLLQRQIKKFITAKNIDIAPLNDFLQAIDRSYDNYENHLSMSQRAMKISSDELFEANTKLREEAESQKKIIDSLNNVVQTLNLKSPENEQKSLEVVDLSTFIEEQSNEILRIDKQREELHKNLERKNQVLSDYAHMVSHDLKSPLRSIDSLVNWIMEDNRDLINEECSTQFDLILKNVEKMDDLITGILNYSTIDQAELSTYDVDTQHLVSEVVQFLYAPAHIKIQIDNNLPVINGDKFRLQQLFQNLIQNAIKSIDKAQGEINIGVKERGHTWEFFIKDNGKGISAQHHNKIFQIFEKIDGDQNSTGIGLSIVRKIIDFYDGDIWLKSKPEEGTTFYFTLPKNK